MTKSKLTVPKLCLNQTGLIRGKHYKRLNKETELVIKDERGKIIGKDSRGHDPRRIKG